MAKGNPSGISKPELVKRLVAHIGLPAETMEDWENCAVLRFGPPGVTLLTVTIATNELENVLGWYVSNIGGIQSDEQARIFRIHKQGERGEITGKEDSIP
jgi:hypothetical protein